MKKIFAGIFILFLLTLLAGCAGVPLPALHSAARAGDTKTVIELLDKGEYNVNELSYGCTPLYFAAWDGRIETVRLLLDRGADIHAKCGGNIQGWSALLVAIHSGQTDVARLLIERGADVDDAMAKLEQMKNTAGFKLLERLAKKQQPSRQTETLAAKPFQDVSPTIKSDIDELPTIKVNRNKNAYAIVIGIENYRQKLPKADYATQDAKLVADYLIKSMGYPEENVVTLLNDRAAKSDFEKYFEKWLHNNVEKGSTVFVYFSGHGAPNTKTGDAYLVPYDGDPSFIDQTGYSLKRMYEALGKLPAKEIVVALDSCFSGAGGRSVIAKGARPLVMNLQGNMALSRNMTVLSASSGEQISSTYDEKGHGLFTYFLLKGIKNEDVIKPDGSIKMEDLFDYIKPQVERIARKQYNNEQTPQLIGAKK